MNLNLLNILKEEGKSALEYDGLYVCLIIFLSLAIIGLFGFITYLLIGFIDEVCDGDFEQTIKYILSVPYLILCVAFYPFIKLGEYVLKYIVKWKKGKYDTDKTISDKKKSGDDSQ